MLKPERSQDGGFMDRESARRNIDRQIETFHTQKWGERVKARMEYHSDPERLLEDIAIVDEGVAKEFAQQYMDSYPRDQWMFNLEGEKRIYKLKKAADINRDFRRWAEKEGLNGDETQLIWKFLAYKYFEGEVGGFIGFASTHLKAHGVEGGLSENRKQVEDTFGEWLGLEEGGPSKKYTEEEEQYIWNGVEWSLFVGEQAGLEYYKFKAEQPPEEDSE